MVRGEAEVGNSFLGKSPVKMTQARVRRAVPLWAQIRDSAVTAAQQFHGSKFLCTFLCSLARPRPPPLQHRSRSAHISEEVAVILRLAESLESFSLQKLAASFSQPTTALTPPKRQRPLSLNNKFRKPSSQPPPPPTHRQNGFRIQGCP